MASVQQQHPYECDQCGTPEIVAVPVLYQQGTRTFSGRFNHGTSQSYSAQAAAPPRPRGYTRPLLLWGPAILIFSVWVWAGFSLILEHPTAMIVEKAAISVLLDISCIAGLLLNLRGISRYNHEVYPQLHEDWTHTYMCRRCGSYRLIPS